MGRSCVSDSALYLLGTEGKQERSGDNANILIAQVDVSNMEYNYIR